MTKPVIGFRHSVDFHILWLLLFIAPLAFIGVRRGVFPFALFLAVLIVPQGIIFTRAMDLRKFGDGFGRYVFVNEAVVIVLALFVAFLAR